MSHFKIQGGKPLCTPFRHSCSCLRPPTIRICFTVIYVTHEDSQVDMTTLQALDLRLVQGV